MPRVLVVSPHFPPVNAPDMQRARQALPHLAAQGWEAEVLAIDPGDVTAPLDPLLCGSLPPGTPVHRVRAPIGALGRLLQRTSLGPRAQPAIERAGDRILAARPFDLVFFTTTQFAVLSAGRGWLARHRVPYVVDWQDPWVTDYYHRPGAPRPPGGWKYRFAAHTARRQEGPALAHAAGVVSVNPPYLRQLEERYPWMARKPRAVIPFGVEESDYERARLPDVVPGFPRRPGARHLVSVGAAGPVMRPAIELLLHGLRQWLAAGGLRETLRLHFIGTSYAPSGAQVPSVTPLAAAAGVADMVDEQPTRLGHFQALRTLVEADGILLLGSDNASYSPSKIATIAWARRPVLGLTAAGSELESGLHAIGLGTVARFSPAPDAGTVVAFLRDFTSPLPAAGQLAVLTAAARTRQLTRFFAEVLASR